MISVLDHGFVKLRNIAGPTRRPDADYDADDIDPANTARISFDNLDENRAREADLKLVEYLIKNRHNTPIEMIEVWFEMKMPIFVARQFVRHRTATINEVSARYATLPEEWYIPKVVGGKAPNAKQGQENNLDEKTQEWFRYNLNEQCQFSYEQYLEAMGRGVAPEHARLFLHVNHFCTHVDTPILTHDLKWVRSGDLKEGDKLLGFEEYPENNKCRKIIPCAVEKFTLEKDDLFEITTENGDTVKCNGEHKWLVGYASGGGYVWKSTNELIKNPNQWIMLKLFDVWEQPNTYEWGFLAGAFDADGFITYDSGNGKQLGFSQNENRLLETIKTMLDIEGFKYTDYKNAKTSDCHTIKIHGGVSKILEFVGKAQPPRIMDKWLSETQAGMFAKEKSRIISIKPVGRGDIASFQTSSGTYIANGYPCHNTHWVWKQDLHNLMNFMSLRDHSHAQIEAQVYGKAIIELVRNELPETMKLYDQYRRQP